ncbi:MAG: ABC transporter permease [Anaerolineae bacterium]|nr:ABC transporter permease [Anaerolineae bacterium]MCO5197606.1 ABC transporter permease [Anaerolineae bacterium]MCO5203772.1 ABC transporter permease [Anaerolineae bacterium]
MGRLIAQRLLFILITALAIIYFGFLGMTLIANNALEEPELTFTEAATVAFDESVTYISGLVRGDFGIVDTVSGPRAVSDILWFSVANSMVLLSLALALAVAVGVPIGVLSALSHKQWRVDAVLTLSVLGVSTPAFVIAAVLQQGGIKYLATFGTRLVSMGGYGLDYQHLVMPVLVLAARPFAYLVRATYVNLTGVMREDFIRTARAKGLRQNAVVGVHAMRNMIVPLLTAIGLSVRFSLSILPLVEFIFAWPGMGLRILEAIQDGQAVLVVSIALVIGLLIQLIGLLLDISYRFVDPRVREAHG